MKDFKFHGLMAPVLTPFNNDSAMSLNLDVIPAYAEYLLKSGITGILVNGTSGEGMSMTVLERQMVAEHWAKACKKTQQCLMIQIGGAVLPDVLTLAKHAETLSADAILCLPELFNKPKTSTELLSYLETVSQAAPNTPLLYYHLPGWTGVNINMADFLNEAYKTLPSLIGIKFTSTILDEGEACLRAGNSSYKIFLGADHIMAGAFTLGFDSAIATSLNMVPSCGQEILRHINQSNVVEARNKQRLLNSYINIITKYGTWVPTMKAAMIILTPINVGLPRSPLKTLTEQEIQQMKTELSKLGLTVNNS